MTTRIWIGGSPTGGASAHDPANWSPRGAPAPGDTLTMSNGTMDVVGNDLASDTLTLAGSNKLPAPTETINTESSATASLDVSPGAGTVLVNANGDSTMALRVEQASDANMIVTIQPGATLTSTLSDQLAPVLVRGGAGSNVVSTGASAAIGGAMTVDADVSGTGTWQAGSYSSVPGIIEFGGAVTNQVVTVGGDPEKRATSKVVFDHPGNDTATLSFSGLAEADFVGLLGVNGYTYDGKTVTLFAGSNPVDSFSLTLNSTSETGLPPIDLEVNQLGDRVTVSSAFTNTPGNVSQLSAAPTPPAPLPPTPPAPPVPPPAPPNVNINQNQNNSTVNVVTPPSPPPAVTVSVPPAPPPVPPPPAPGPTVINTTTNNITNVVTTGAPPANAGTTPTVLSASEIQIVNSVNSVSPGTKAGGFATFLDRGQILGEDFQNEGAGVSSGQNPTSFNNQTITDIKELLSAYVSAAPDIATGVSIGGGPTLAIPPQFVVDVINNGLKAVTIGNPGLDKAYGSAVAQFFGQEQTAFTVAIPHM